MFKWTNPPTLSQVKEVVCIFFDRLAVGDEEGAFSFVAIKLHKGCDNATTRRAHLYGLWEDLDSWLEDLDDPSFEGPWLTTLTSLREMDEKSLAWRFSNDDAILAEHDYVLVNVCCLREPTDDTAQFSIIKTESGYGLRLDMIHVM